MILYNVTINVEEDVHEEWVEWMKAVHIPNVMRTGMFIDHRFLRMLVDEEMGGITYAVQYTCESPEVFSRYEQEFAPGLRAEVQERYNGKFVTFRSLLEFV